MIDPPSFFSKFRGFSRKGASGTPKGPDQTQQGTKSPLGSDGVSFDNAGPKSSYIPKSYGNARMPGGRRAAGTTDGPAPRTYTDARQPGWAGGPRPGGATGGPPPREFNPNDARFGGGPRPGGATGGPPPREFNPNDARFGGGPRPGGATGGPPPKEFNPDDARFGDSPRPAANPGARPQMSGKPGPYQSASDIKAPLDQVIATRLGHDTNGKAVSSSGGSLEAANAEALRAVQSGIRDGRFNPEQTKLAQAYLNATDAKQVIALQKLKNSL